ncbi:MAG: cystathionine beta-lyase [Caulobacterales bacterium]|nr:cystathionine beta-lyase [Caulobacterales bacterium]
MTRPDRPRPVNPPVERASTLLFDRAEDVYRTDVVTYGRHGLTVHDELKRALMELEGGAACTLTPSGVSAISTAALGLCGAGDHLLVTDNAYGPTRRFARLLARRMGLETEFFDPRAGADIARLFRPNTRAILMESPGSLTFELHDVPAITAAAQDAGIATMLDDTWGAGLAFKPLDHGVDAALHAATKFPSGGSDVLLGAAVSRTPEIGERIQTFATHFGVAVSPDDAYMVLRGMRSLKARFARQQESALALASWLRDRREVALVLHPGLDSHPDHGLWRRDFLGGGALFAIVVRGWSEAQVLAFLNALTVIGLGFSYGGFESLAIWCDPQLKREVGPWRAEGPLIRLAVGLEPLSDLVADLERGFAAAAV